MRIFEFLAFLVTILADHCGEVTPPSAAGPYFQEDVPEDKGGQGWCNPVGDASNLQFIYVNGTVKKSFFPPFIFFAKKKD